MLHIRPGPRRRLGRRLRRAPSTSEVNAAQERLKLCRVASGGVAVRVVEVAVVRWWWCGTVGRAVTL